MLHAADTDKQMSQQQLQNLTCVLNLLKHNTVKSMDDFLSRLKFDIGLF